MSGSPCHFTFHDSSDDENNERVVEIVPLAGVISAHTSQSPEHQQQQQPQRPSWLRQAFGSAVAAIGAVFSLNEPFATSGASRDLSSGSTEWQYREGGDTNVPPRSAASADLSEQDELTLLEVIEQYNRTPDDVYMRIILAALTAENVAVNGEMFRAAAGNCMLIEKLLQSGKVDVNDPDVQRVIQDEIDTAVVGDRAHDGRLAPEKIGFLTMLCRVPSATMTREQAQLCARSGFEFVEMLEDSKHVLRNIPPTGWIIARFLNMLNIIETVISAFSLIMVLINIACVVWIAYYWFTSHHLSSMGYPTIACFVVGYVFSIVATMSSEEGRTRNYEHYIWDYPDNSLKVVPVFPLFEVAIVHAILRYRLLKDKSRYFVIRYDLHNGATNLFIIDTLFLALPQMLMQFYIFRLYAPERIEFAGFKLLVAVGYTSYVMSLFLFIRKIMYNHSCDTFGFSVVASKHASTMPVDVTLRILVVMLVYYIECNVISGAFSLLHIGSCTSRTAAFLTTLVCVEILVILGLILALVFQKPRSTVFFCFPILVIQIAYSIYVATAGDSKDEDIKCKLFALTSPLVSPYTYITFGFWCGSLLLWIAFFLFYCITGKQLYTYWEQFYLPELIQ